MVAGGSYNSLGAQMGIDAKFYQGQVVFLLLSLGKKKKSSVVKAWYHKAWWPKQDVGFTLTLAALLSTFTTWSLPPLN